MKTRVFLLITCLFFYVIGNDHYNTLGIQKNANENQIKKAYKKLALKFHPDRNKGNKEAEKKFIKISHAYEVLKDPKKREEYDIYGQTHEEYQQQGGSNGHHNGYDPYSSHFNDAYNQHPGFDAFEAFKHFFNEEQHQHHEEDEYDDEQYGNDFHQSNHIEIMNFSELDSLINMGTHPFSHHPHLIFLFSGGKK